MDRRYGMPGSQYVPNRLSEMLYKQNYNNGSTTGGLAHVLQQIMMGMDARDEKLAQQKDMADQNAAMQAMTQGMAARQWEVPDGAIRYGSPEGEWISRQDAMENAAPAGGYEGGISALQNLPDNAYAGRLTQDLLMKQAERKMSIEDEARRGANDLYKFREQEKIKSEFAKPKAPVPHSDIAKINADVKAGLLTPEQGAAQIRKLQQPGGAFEGSGMPAQFGNIILNYERLKRQGIQTTPDQDAAYAFAYRNATQPKIFQGPDGRQYMMPGMNLEGFPVPQTPGGVGQDALPMKGQPGMKAQPAIQQAPNMPPGVQQIGGTAEDQKNAEVMKKKNLILTDLSSGLDAYEKMIDKGGMELMPSEGKAELQTVYMNLLMQIKDYLNLGVLNGPDLELITKMFSDPTSPTTLALGGAAGIKKQIGAMRDLLKQSNRNAGTVYGGQPAGPQRMRYNPATGQIEPVDDATRVRAKDRTPG